MALVIGAELETRFPKQPVTEIWSAVILLSIFGLLFKWAYKTDNKRAYKLLLDSGLYSAETITSMSYNELLLRESMHKKDSSTNWSEFTFKQLKDLQASEKEAKRAEKAERGGFVDGFKSAQQGSKGFYGTHGKRIVCKNCGVRMMKHFGLWTDSAICQGKGIKCVPYEVPDL